MKLKLKKLLLPALIFSFIIMVAGCKTEPEPAGPVYGSSPADQQHQTFYFAVHPLHNPAKLSSAYQPLVDYLNMNLAGARIVLEASRDYTSFEDKLKASIPDLILPNPWQTLQAMQNGYKVIASAGEPEEFKGLFIVRRDSKIKTPADLDGQVVSYPSATALAACIMPQYFLHQHGLDINSQIQNSYVGSQESSIMNAYLGYSAAAATWPIPWRAFQQEHPKEAAELKVIWETPHLINNSVMVRDDLPKELVIRITDLLVSLHKNRTGKAILSGIQISRFLPATDQDYDLVREYIQHFEQQVRLVGSD